MKATRACILAYKTFLLFDNILQQIKHTGSLIPTALPEKANDSVQKLLHSLFVIVMSFLHLESIMLQGITPV